MRSNVLALVLAAAVAMGLVGCSGDETPHVSSIAVKVPTATATAPVEADGTRTNPLGVGESRKVAVGSMWTVAAEAATVVGDGYVVLPLRLEIDWDAAVANGIDPDSAGVDPWQSLSFNYVTAAGRSYNTNDGFEARPPVPPELYEVGAVYPPTDSLSANVAITVPSDQVAGGVWRVSNVNDDAVFIGGG